MGGSSIHQLDEYLILFEDDSVDYVSLSDIDGAELMFIDE